VNRGSTVGERAKTKPLNKTNLEDATPPSGTAAEKARATAGPSGTLRNIGIELLVRRSRRASY
jgi:hypothetical protein